MKIFENTKKLHYSYYVENVRKFNYGGKIEISNNYINKITLNNLKIFKVLINVE
jgi:hypothetical protein